MNFSTLKPAAGIVLALAAGFAQGATVDFTTAHASIGKSFIDVADGFDFESNWGLGLTMTKSALAETIATTLKLSTLSGEGFDLRGFDLADVLNLGLSNKVVLQYTFENGTTGSNTFTLDRHKGFQTFDLSSYGLDNLQSFTLKGGNALTSFQLDNLQVTAVPEPESLALLLAGFGMLGVVARRRTL